MLAVRWSPRTRRSRPRRNASRTSSAEQKKAQMLAAALAHRPAQSVLSPAQVLRRTRTTTRSSGPSRSTTTPTRPSPSAPLGPSDPARGTSSSEPATRGRTPTLLATTTLGGARRRSGTSSFLWASLYSEPMPACSAALALGGGGIVRRIASPQAPALSSALGGSLVKIVILIVYLYKSSRIL